MTFLGTIPSPLRSIIKEAAGAWSEDDVYIGCSGNFTIERTLRDADVRFRPHSNDVSIYTTALGNWLTGKPVELRLTEKWLAEVGWLEEYLDDSVGSVAALLLLTHFAPDLGNPHTWAQRNVNAHRVQWTKLYQDTVTKLTENRFPVASYDCMDVREWLNEKVPDDATVVSFPPFDKGGYEKLYQRLDEIFDWPRPTYEILDEDGVQAVVDKIADRPRWLMGLLHEREELAEFHVGQVQIADAARPFFVYAKGNDAPLRYVMPSVKTEPVLAPRLSPGDVIGDHMTLRPLTTGQFETLRTKYLAAGIKVTGGNLNYPHAVCVDDKIVGVICFGMWLGDGIMQLTTDLAVAPHDYARLSKLVVMAALSKEAQRINERGWARRMRTVQTAVFSNAPVSMKYRGLMQVRDREELAEGDQYRYKITYTAPAGQWTLDEALADWKGRWGTRDTSKPDLPEFTAKKKPPLADPKTVSDIPAVEFTTESDHR